MSFIMQKAKNVSGIIRPMSTWSGKTLGNVLIGDLIARGGMAEVYYGVHSTLNRKVAIKIMRDHVEEDPDSRARFAREARVVATLDHPNIIQIYDYDLVDGRPCIVMELVEGTSLAGYLKELHKRGEKLPHPIVAKLMKSIASAMDHAHERNIVHRDIKPANILLRSKQGVIDLQAPLPEDIEPVLTDFGLVRLLDSNTKTSTGTVSGTPSYMSPEQARGDSVDHRTDIYSLGVVLYEMLAGEVPFDAESSFGVLMKHLNEPPPPINGISAGMQAIINRALAKDPKDRFASAIEMVNEFADVLEGKSVSKETLRINSLPKETTANAKQAASSFKTPLLVGGGIIALALIVSLGVFIFRQPRETNVPSQNNNQLPNPSQPIGSVVFDDYNELADNVTVTISGIPLPPAGQHFEVWFLGQGGEIKLNAGPVIFTGQNGQLIFSDSNGANLLSQFDEMMVTVEPDNDPNPDQPSQEVAASSVFPPQAFVHIRHILVSIGMTPNGTALIQGVWDTADTIDTSVLELRDAFNEGDEATLRIKNEEIINQLVGEENLQLYKDWNEDGEINDPNDGFGLLANGTEQGYIPLTISHTEFAIDAPDATTGIIQSGQNLIVCLQNMEGWSEQLLEVALKLQSMPYGTGMESTIAEIETYSSLLLYGEDTNGNNRIEPLPGEAGADTAYFAAYSIAQMPIFPGGRRMPQPANTTQP